MQEKIKKIVPVAGLIILIILFAFTTKGKFATFNNIKNIVMQSSIALVAAIGTVFVMAHNNLDFSLGGVCAMASVLAFFTSGGNLILFFILSIVYGIGCGLISAFIHIKGQVPAFMAGLCIMFAGRGFAQAIYANNSMLVVEAAKYNTLEVFLTIDIIIVVLGIVFFNYSKIGKYQKLIGSNPKAAQLSGINVGKYKAIAFAISGATVGVAACLTVMRNTAVTGNTGLNLETDVLVALSLGGIPMTGGSATKIRSAIIGVFVYFILNNGLTLWGLNADYVDIVKAIFFLFTVTISIDRSQKTVMI